MQRVNIIGSGFSGLSAAAYLAKAGFEVHVYEKNEQLGGRAAKFETHGFTFDMGPSWYWMPDVFERFYQDFGHTASDFYDLKRLDPSYRVFWDQDHWDIPANFNDFKALLDAEESGAGKKLDQFLKEAKFKYEAGMKDFVFRPSHNWLEYINWQTISAATRLDMFTSIRGHLKKFFKHPKLMQLMEFPVLFLGAKPDKTPALYSLMNYADIVLGTWYPMGGMNEIVQAFVKIGESLGVQYHVNSPVAGIRPNGSGHYLQIKGYEIHSDFVVAAADYHHVEQKLLQPEQRNYRNENYWPSRTMAPTSLLFYVGVDKKIPGLKHHNLFFDAPFDQHATEIYDTHEWPKHPLFYVCNPSKTDPSVAPEGKENLFFLMPLSSELEDTEEKRAYYFDLMMDRLEARTETNIRDAISYKKSFAKQDFMDRYHSYRGNAYGLANTLKQTGAWKPKLKNRHLKNFYYAGQLTVPGPGVPPSIISGNIVANEIIRTKD
ncbi:MAG TPA: phytoene desaturase family protein [Saprospiraceae bacterium]|nr:phytoene desaturase family protein [Saprospiraceae bacterium]